jgi:membrane associated rhomboid family serine protease
MFIPLRDENPTVRRPYVTFGLIALNVLFFALGIISPQGLEQDAARFGAIPFAVTHFWSLHQALPVPPLLTLLTSLFVHGSLFHLLGNMLYLWIFGNNVEDVLGGVRFALFYLACGLAAGLTQVAATPGSLLPMIGASGAIAGVLGAYWVLFPRARVLTLIFVFVVPVPAGIVLGLWFVLQLLNVGMGGGVAWFAHIGGFLAGIALILATVRGRSRRRRRGSQVDNFV